MDETVRTQGVALIPTKPSPRFVVRNLGPHAVFVGKRLGVGEECELIEGAATFCPDGQSKIAVRAES